MMHRMSGLTELTEKVTTSTILYQQEAQLMLTNPCDAFRTSQGHLT